ncbi:MAG: amidohydrolase family protein [Cyclobacteriaceae bacterium]
MSFFSNLRTNSIYSVVCLLSLLTISGCSTNNQSSSTNNASTEESFKVIIGGTVVGYLKAYTAGDSITIDYDYKNNGRGPTIKEAIVLDEKGFPVRWDIAGSTTFGNKADEHFQLDGNNATWKDAAGGGSKTISEPSLYIEQFGSAYSRSIYARALLDASDLTLPAIPTGELMLKELETTTSNITANELTLKSYALYGAGLNPQYLILDEEKTLFASISRRFIIIRDGFEDEEKRFRQLAEKYSAERFEKLQNQFAHNYPGKIRINNVRIFDPKTQSLTEASSVLVEGEKIISIDAPDSRGDGNETQIDGKGGTLVAGLYDMHGHMRTNAAALLNVLAGVTSVRDMGNNNEVLSGLIQKIESRILAGPRITRLGFIEGKSPFNNNNGILVESEEQALEAVDTYAEQGFYGVKLYNSMNGDWAPAIVKKAHELNMFVTGHVPAFSNANAMLKAGFDEMTHINQVMLGWVLKPDEDTRTLLRLTALKRLPDLDLNSPAVNETLDLMVKNKVAVDPTLAIHEALLLSRNGTTRIGTLDYIENMPANEQRSARVAWADIANDADDKAYRQAFDQIVATLKIMKDRGIFIVPGTDLGGALTLHRELELYQQLGYTPSELLKLGSYDMAQYLGHEDRGAIEPGMLADFFLIPGDPTADFKAIKTISMVSRGGVIYYPSEIYPAFGIKPFTEVPEVK